MITRAQRLVETLAAGASIRFIHVFIQLAVSRAMGDGYAFRRPHAFNRTRPTERQANRKDGWCLIARAISISARMCSPAWYDLTRPRLTYEWAHASATTSRDRIPGFAARKSRM